MTSVRKSPNMMSTTGRIPVIAAPTPRPVMPASEMGESRIRSGPNSSTSPESTLKGVPASATSSPITNTVGSRRSSSASASFTACPKVSSRAPVATAVALGIDVLRDLAGSRERRVQRELDRVGDLSLDACAHSFDDVVADARCEQRDRIVLARPVLLLVLRAVVGAVDVADVVTVEAVRQTLEEARAVTCTGARHCTQRRLVG